MKTYTWIGSAETAFKMKPVVKARFKCEDFDIYDSAYGGTYVTVAISAPDITGIDSFIAGFEAGLDAK